MTECKEKEHPYYMCDGFGRIIDEDIYWRNTGLSQAAVARVKKYHSQHPVDLRTGKRRV